MRNSAWIFLLLFTCLATAQQQDGRHALYGKVISGNGEEVPGIFVINIATGTEVKTDAKGLFTIMAQPGDQLALYSTTIKTRKFDISEDSFKSVPYVLSVEQKAYEMKEVVIEDTINEVSLGIVSKDQKHYTPAERKWKAGGEFKPIYLLGIFGGGVPLDPLINRVTGRVKKLKKNLATERKEMLLEDIKEKYTDTIMQATFKIPAEYTGGFAYYLMEDEVFVKLFRAGETEKADFRVQQLAEAYLKLKEDEK